MDAATLCPVYREIWLRCPSLQDQSLGGRALEVSPRRQIDVVMASLGDEVQGDDGDDGDLVEVAGGGESLEAPGGVCAGWYVIEYFLIYSSYWWRLRGL